MAPGRILAATLLLAACAPGVSSGPVEVVWDRDACERCAMAISDRRFAAQVRSPGDHRPHRFDDLGCALLWIDEQDWGEEGAEEIWVRDLDGEQWLPAADAGYVRVETSPMDFGWGAVEAAKAGSIDLGEAREQIRTAERGRRSAGR